jgi:hypothetical protein
MGLVLVESLRQLTSVHQMLTQVRRKRVASLWKGREWIAKFRKHKYVKMRAPAVVAGKRGVHSSE